MTEGSRPKRRGVRRPKEVVSYNMSKIRASGSVIEKKLGSAMFRLGLRYRKQYPIFGRPDFAFPRSKVAVFCDSAFWHGRNWETAKDEIKVNREFWIHKIEKNMKRDSEVNRRLEAEGWKVVRFWDDEIESDTDQCAHRVGDILEQQESAITRGEST